MNKFGQVTFVSQRYVIKHTCRWRLTTRTARFIAVGMFAFVPVHASCAQHCAPIYESYLSEISVGHVKDAIKIRCEYAKRGGQPKEKYQAYLLAYLDKNTGKIPAKTPDSLIDPYLVMILHTQLIERNKEGGYDLEFKIDGDELAKRMIEHGRLTEKDRTPNVGSGMYNDTIRLTVFVPFLEDTKYAVLKGLPENKHECNHANDRALLFQQLPYSLSIYFVESGSYQIHINGDKPATPARS